MPSKRQSAPTHKPRSKTRDRQCVFADTNNRSMRLPAEADAKQGLIPLISNEAAEPDAGRLKHTCTCS